MPEQHTGMSTATAQGLWVGSTKRMIVAEPPRAWAERPLKRKGRELRDPLIRKLMILLILAAIAALAAILIGAMMGMDDDAIYIILSVGAIALVWGIPMLLLLRRVRGRLRDAKPDSLTTESYGDACVLRDVRCKPRRIRIPETYRGMRLIAAEGGFARKGRYDTVILPESMERLADGLFLGCRNLTQVQLPGRIEAVPPSMMEKCTALTAIVVPLSVKRIGKRAFAGCKSLRDVYITAAVKEIAEDAFEGCTDVMFHVQEGSVAEHFVRERELSYTYKYV